MQASLKETREICPICLSRPRNPSRPDACTHLFCHNCLLEWAKIENTCPVCKQKFKKVTSLSAQPPRKKARIQQPNSKVEQQRSREVPDRSQEEQQEQRMFGVLCGRQTRYNEMAFFGVLCMIDEVVDQ